MGTAELETCFYGFGCLKLSLHPSLTGMEMCRFNPQQVLP
jgi:hypothetical protein